MRVIALVATALVAACGWDAATMNPVDRDHPCGVKAYACGNGNCCWNDMICGTGAPFDRCANGYCCYEPDDLVSSAKPAKWQWEAGAP